MKGTDMEREVQELSCEEALEIVSASFDGEAGLEEIDALADHLLGCPGCRRTALQLEADDEILRRTGAGGPTAPRRSAAVGPMLPTDAPHRGQLRRPRWPWLVAAASLAAAAPRAPTMADRLPIVPPGTNTPPAPSPSPHRSASHRRASFSAWAAPEPSIHEPP